MKKIIFKISTGLMIAPFLQGCGASVKAGVDVKPHAFNPTPSSGIPSPVTTTPSPVPAPAPDWRQWPLQSATWRLTDRQCAKDGNALLAGPGTLKITLDTSSSSDEIRFNFWYDYVHDRHMGSEYESVYCSFVTNYTMMVSKKAPTKIVYQEGSMIDSGTLCLTYDKAVKDEWRYSPYTFEAPDSKGVLKIHTYNSELCSDGDVLNSFEKQP